MRSIATFLCAALIPAAALAQAPWDKTYSVTAKPAVQLELDNSPVHVHSCGECRSVHIHVDWRGGDPERWILSEMQGGNGIHFSLKQRQENSWFNAWHGRAPEVAVDTPMQTDLDAHTGNGDVSVNGLHGSLSTRTGNGAIQTEETSGSLRVDTGNGAVTVRRAEGPLYANSGNGALMLEGRFSGFDVHTGNGKAELNLLPGSVLQSGSRVTTGDGSVSLHVPGDLRADVDASTGNGGIHCDLPLQGSTNERSHVHGLINGGGPSLRLHSGDGSITLSR